MAKARHRMFYHNHLIWEYGRYLGPMSWYTTQSPGKSMNKFWQPSEIRLYILGKDGWVVRDQLQEHRRPNNSTENHQRNQVEASKYHQHSACRLLRCQCEHTPVPSPSLFKFESQVITAYLFGRIEDNAGDKPTTTADLDILPPIRLRSCLPVDKAEGAKCQSYPEFNSAGHFERLGNCSTIAACLVVLIMRVIPKHWKARKNSGDTCQTLRKARFQKVRMHDRVVRIEHISSGESTKEDRILQKHRGFTDLLPREASTKKVILPYTTQVVGIEACGHLRW